MANSKEVVLSEVPQSPEFIKELIPYAERTALLYHLSYLCLGGFPKLERLIREQAVGTQMLFGSFKEILQECFFKSHYLVSSVFPRLTEAVEKNKPILAVEFLEIASSYINDIIRDVDDVVNRYGQQNRSVASCISDVFQEQCKTERHLTQLSDEMKRQQEAVNKLEEELRKNAENVKEIEKQIEGKKSEIEHHISSISRTSHDMSIMTIFLPIVGHVIKSIYDTATGPGDAAKTQALEAELDHLLTKKNNLKIQEQNIQVKRTNLQLKLATSRIQLGLIPSPVHLKDVQKCLSQIQQILIQLKLFWEKTGSLLDIMKDKTFAAEDLIEELDDTDLKEVFLEYIDIVGKCWNTLGRSCLNAYDILSMQSKDMYKFLEIKPSSLSDGERKKQYESVMMKLNKISVQYSSKAAITE